MSIQTFRNGVIDQIELEGRLDASHALLLSERISQFRKEGSTNLLWNGEKLISINPLETQILERAFRLFRQFGGRIALVGFSPTLLELVDRTAWSRHINVFSTVEDATVFLNRGAKPEIVPVIEPMVEDVPDEEAVDAGDAAQATETSAEPKPAAEQEKPAGAPTQQEEEKPLTYDDIFADIKETEEPRKEDA